MLTLHNCQPKNVPKKICHRPRYGNIGALNFCGKSTPLDFSCGNGIFNVPKIYEGSNDNFEIFCQMNNIKGLYFENLKRKIGVIGQQINMGRCGKRQRIGYPQKWPSCESSGANLLKLFVNNCIGKP